jgi:hypothetical protein
MAQDWFGSDGLSDRRSIDGQAASVRDGSRDNSTTTLQQPQYRSARRAEAKRRGGSVLPDIQIGQPSATVPLV